jgi:hypothetical protein
MAWTVAQAAQNERTPGRLTPGRLTSPIAQPKPVKKPVKKSARKGT